MAKISFARNTQILTVTPGTTLMEALTNAGIPVASSCGGNGVCSKCKIQIIKGAENLSPPEDLENFIRENNEFAANERMSCQAQVLGDITIDTTYW